MSERIGTLAAAIAAALDNCEATGGSWTVETARGVLAVLHNDAEPRQGIFLRLERGRLHISGDYPRATDNWTPWDIERPAISVDPARDAAAIVARDIARRFWPAYCEALRRTVEANARRAREEAQRQEMMARLARAGDGALSRSFPELVSGRRWQARVGLRGVASLELRDLDAETACAVLALVRGRVEARKELLPAANSGL